MKQYGNLMEKLWLSIAVAIGIYAIYTLVKSGIEAAAFHFLFSAAATAMFFIRKRMNKALAKHIEQKDKPAE